MVPEMIPVAAVIASPAGSPVAENVSGVCPVAGIENTSGVAARAANVNGPCSRGAAGAAVIEMVMVDCARAAPAVDIATPSAIPAITTARARDCVRIDLLRARSAGQAPCWLTNRRAMSRAMSLEVYL